MSKALLFSIALLLSGIGTSVSAQIQGNYPIYGLLRDGSTQSMKFGKLNTTNGQGIPIANNDVATSYTLNGMATIDSEQDRYYFVTPSGIQTVDMNSGFVINSVNMVMPQPQSYFDMIQYYTGDSTVYGLLRDGSSMKWSKIDPTTGVVTIVNNNSLGSTSVLNGFATIDQNNGIYYFLLGNGQVRGVDVTTGNVVSTPTLSTTSNQYIDGLQFNCSTNELYAMLRMNSSSYLATINPYSGFVNQISTSPIAGSYVLNGLATIDDVNGVYYFIDGSYSLKGVDLSNGAVVASHPLNLSTGNYFDLMVFKPITCGITGSQTLPTTVNEVAESPAPTAFPNPANDQINIKADGAVNTPYALFSITGELVKSGYLNADITTVDVSGLTEGLYLLRVEEEVIKVAVKH